MWLQRQYSVELSGNYLSGFLEDSMSRIHGYLTLPQALNSARCHTYLQNSRELPVAARANRARWQGNPFTSVPTIPPVK